MKFNLLSLLLLFIPASLFLMGTHTWIRNREFEWSEFDLGTLDSSLQQHDFVLIHVSSAFGRRGDRWLNPFLQNPKIVQAISDGTILPSTFEFRYVSRAPAGLEEEYEWVYKQETYIKDAFFAIYEKDGKKSLYTLYDDPDAAVASLNLPDWEWRYRLMSVISLVSIAAYFVCFTRNSIPDNK